MLSAVQEFEAQFKKPQVIGVKSGDTVKVHQKIREGNKERIQIFQGLVIKVANRGSLTSRISVRRIASGVGVEKTFLLHSPSILKVEVTKRSKVRRNYLTYMRQLTGKSARLSGVNFDKAAVNSANEIADDEEAAVHQQLAEEAAKKAEKEAAEKAKIEAQAEAALAAREQSTE